jgi:hypothetical protein
MTGIRADLESHPGALRLRGEKRLENLLVFLEGKPDAPNRSPKLGKDGSHVETRICRYPASDLRHSRSCSA